MRDNLLKTRVTRWLTFIYLFSLLLASLSLLTCLAATLVTTKVSVSPSSITAYVNQDFSIDLVIGDVVDLYGWEFKLSWNPTLLSVVSVIECPFLKTGGNTFFSHNENQDTGHMIVDCTLLGLVPGVNGDGILATITFNVKTAGECPLDLYDVLLLDSFERQIISEAIDGYGNFSASDHDIAITSVYVSPRNVLPGQMVQVNVTAQNQGARAESFNVAAYANSEIIGIQPVSLDSGTSRIIQFTWDTTGHSKGVYTIYANATAVLGEVDMADNNKTADETVTILYNGHDIAISSVEPSKTVVCETYCISIVVTVVNYGLYPESFNVSVNVNSTILETKNTALNSGDSVKLDFIWNTTGFTKGNHVISAYAAPVPGETETGDNFKTDGIVAIAMIGDIIPDGVVDIFDVTTVAVAFGSIPYNPNWNPNADINNDQTVDIFDIVVVALHFGETG